MQIIRFDSPAEFARQTTDFLQAREAEHNLMLGITTMLLQTNEYAQPPYMACVKDGDAVVAVALRTPPFNLQLSEMTDMAPLDLIVQDVHAVYDTLPGGAGPKAVSLAFAERWKALTGHEYHQHIALRIYRLDQVKFPVGVPGGLRRATADDRNLLIEWLSAFYLEALNTVDPEYVERSVNSFLTSPMRGLYLWLDDSGQPVSMAGSTGPTPNGIRINAVYTPPERRKRGYASACVAALSQTMLDSGRKFCFLFTDLSNPTSNRIYQDIGYRPVSDVDEYHFESPAS
ncbi:MAG: GNAT family N-acetyltransferase [Anaerolineae bacterium]|nr:GNAT family N-acetyltransferase [Anaerolineae bacterium]